MALGQSLSAGQRKMIVIFGFGAIALYCVWMFLPRGYTPPPQEPPAAVWFCEKCKTTYNLTPEQVRARELDETQVKFLPTRDRVFKCDKCKTFSVVAKR